MLAPDGRIFAIPFNATDILIIDPVAGTATRDSLGLPLVGTFKWAGGVLGPDGRIYAIPSVATDILVMDPPGNQATRLPISAAVPANLSKWRGGILGPGGVITRMPLTDIAPLRISPFPVNFPVEVLQSPALNRF